MEGNNENPFPSQLPQPNRNPSPGKLVEMSASANNARSSSTSMPPPTSNPLKRKTLAERGGELVRPTLPPPSSRPVSNITKSTSIAGAARQNSFSSSVSSTHPSSHRHASFSGSVNMGPRPPSTQAHRPQSALAGSRLQTPSAKSSRPRQAVEPYPLVSKAVQGGVKHRGRVPFSSTPLDLPEQPALQETNRSYDTPMKSISKRASGRFTFSTREMSLSTAFNGLCISDQAQSTSIVGLDAPHTPSQLPKRVPSVVDPTESPSPSKSRRKTCAHMAFLTRDSNVRAVPWDTNDKTIRIEREWDEFKGKIEFMTAETKASNDLAGIYKAKVLDLESSQTELAASNTALQAELESSKHSAKVSSDALEDMRRHHSIQIDDLQRQHRRDLEDSTRLSQEEVRHLVREHEDSMKDLRKSLETALEDERVRHRAEIQSLTTESAVTQRITEVELEKAREVARDVEGSLQQLRSDLLLERSVNSDLRVKLSESSGESISLETTIRSLRAHVEFLESDNKSQSHAFVDLETRLQNALRTASEANDKLRTEETLRRKLHNQVQELRGNIRVFCRVRPSLESEPGKEAASISYPDTGSDSKEVEILGQEEKSSLGNITTKKNAFAFDRVFTPDSANADVFEEISQLVQSALDGYNVCIFCYGQTGSGKTYTMSSEDGMVPRAVHQIYDTAKSLEEKGWKYSMEGSFIEVYNENLNDLLGKPEEYDKKKHEIRHDMQKCKTTITELTTVDLDTPGKVESILNRAASNRSVAATKANERSSRSHSVFILKLVGENSMTGERSEGTLNLVDLAGSERLSHSKATGDRLKETQNINKSLSCLADVIGALGQGKEGGHIPYRNSKLTYLLQFSLGGNSKTLMFVMISPLQAHLSETLTSLKFATKVHNTHIGTAKRQAKIRD